MAFHTVHCGLYSTLAVSIFEPICLVVSNAELLRDLEIHSLLFWTLMTILSLADIGLLYSVVADIPPNSTHLHFCYFVVTYIPPYNMWPPLVAWH